MKSVMIRLAIVVAILGVVLAHPLFTGCNTSKKIPSKLDQDVDYSIPLQNRTFTPDKGVSDALQGRVSETSDSLYVLIQFKKTLTLEDFRLLNENGIQLGQYLGGNAYWAIVDKGFADKRSSVRKMVRWADLPQRTDKLSRKINAGEYNEYARDSISGEYSFLVKFYPNVNARAIRSAIQNIDEDAGPYGSRNQWRVYANPQEIVRLADQNIVMFIEQGPLPFLPLNNGGTRVTRTNEAQQVEYGDIAGSPAPTFKKVNGNGIRIGICDSGVDENHNDFFTITAAGTRGVSRVYSTSVGSGSHGTHVASIAAGNGFNSLANGFPAYHFMGHAPEAMIGDYSFFGNNTALYYDAIVNDGTDVTNHSYVQTIEPAYDSEAADIDRIIRGDASGRNGDPIPPRPQVWAAGNNGLSAQYGNEEGYYSVFTSAKNSISIGSTDTELSRLSDFSSLGPTFDGRIKPDVVAPGCENSIPGFGNSIDAANNNTQGYTGKCGTSMAAPAATGIVALMMDQYQNEYGSIANIPPSMYKAVLIQTAKDMIKTSAFADMEFTNPDLNAPIIYHAGPDFATGYGLIDAEAAREKIIKTNHQRTSTIGGTGLTHNYCVYVPKGTDELKLTLAWDDEPGSILTAVTFNKLVNDLDLVLESPSGTLHYPWTLDPVPLTASPGSGDLDPINLNDIRPAYKSPDHRNNVEMAQVCNPESGTWKVRVTGFNLPNGNGQRYSLVSSHAFNFFCLFNICDIAPWICDPIFDFPFRIVKRVDKDLLELNPRHPIPIDEICKYVLDCPGCNGPGWALCPGFDVRISDLPRGINVKVINQEGKVTAQQLSRGETIRLPVKNTNVHDQYYLIFSDEKGNQLKENVKINIQISE